MIIKVNELRELQKFLRAMCHAPGCDRVKNCPNQCGCRSRRSFELNTETAICWELADSITMLVVGVTVRGPRKSLCKDLVMKATAYSEISRFHMTAGWERFFEYIVYYIKALTIRQRNPYYGFDSLGDMFESLKRTGSRLKRYPRV